MAIYKETRYSVYCDAEGCLNNEDSEHPETLTSFWKRLKDSGWLRQKFSKKDPWTVMCPECYVRPGSRLKDKNNGAI